MQDMKAYVEEAVKLQSCLTSALDSGVFHAEPALHMAGEFSIDMPVPKYYYFSLSI
jgi:hypothetical protein